MSNTVSDRLEKILEIGSNADKALARFMLNSLADLPFETAASIATKVSVSEATVSRFCRTLGYHGFRELKDDLKNNSRSYPWLIDQHLQDVQSATNEGDLYLARGLELELAAIAKVYELAATQVWRTVVKRLSETPRVFVCGFQTERGIAQYFCNQLQYVRDGVVLLDLAAGNFSELFASSGPKCLIVFEARRYSRLAKSLVQKARAAEIEVTLVTDLFCEWAGEATETLTVQTQINQFTESTAVMANLGNLLVNGVCARLGSEVGSRLERIADLYEEFTGHVGDPAGKLLR